MPHLLLFGPGYTGERIAERLESEAWRVTRVRRKRDASALSIDDHAAVNAAIATASHIISSVPPEGEIDPVLSRYGEALANAPTRWIGYISSTGVYGDTEGAWVDETAPIGGGRRSARTQADLAWQRLGAHISIFRLPGIYGPGRSMLDRVREGCARRLVIGGHVFSRIHVDDIVSGVIAALDGPPGVYNLADDCPASPNAVVEYACALLNIEPPPLQTIDEAGLSPAARAFYSENRRIANGKAKRVLGWVPQWRDYRAGLRALSAITMPISANTPPATVSSDQR